MGIAAGNEDIHAAWPVDIIEDGYEILKKLDLIDEDIGQPINRLQPLIDEGDEGKAITKALLALPIQMDLHERGGRNPIFNQMLLVQLKEKKGLAASTYSGYGLDDSVPSISIQQRYSFLPIEYRSHDHILFDIHLHLQSNFE